MRESPPIHEPRSGRLAAWSLGPGPDGVASRGEVAHGRLADPPRAREGDSTLHDPAGDGHGVEQLARQCTQPVARPDDTGELERALVVDRLAVRDCKPEHEPDLVEGEH